MDPLPLPPPPPAAAAMRAARIARPGQVTAGWRAVFVIGWGGVMLCLGAVVKSSRTLGLSTWWLGPESDAQPVVLQILPFAIPIAMIVLGFRNVRFLPYFGLLGAVALAAIATGDLGRFDGLAQVELVAAGVALLVSIAAFAGLLRPDDRADAGGASPEPATGPPMPFGPPAA